ncbi:MAG: hypothetical protein ACR2OE_03295 [Thermomicrobiales bacterium]
MRSIQAPGGAKHLTATVRPGGGFTRMATAQGVIASPIMASAAPVVTLASTSFLFVQNFSGVRNRGDAGVYTLGLPDGMGYTLYFSDRPERLTGTVRTSTFLNDLGSSPQNPPNPALVVQTNESAPDQEDILVCRVAQSQLWRGDRHSDL